MTKDTNISDQQLKLDIAAGCEQAFKCLFDQYHGRLYAYVFNMTKSSEIAEELVMDVFIKFWLGRELIPQISNINAFLFRVAYHKTIDFFRSAAANKKVVELLAERMDILDSSDPFESILSKEYETHLRKAVSLLPPRRQEIYRLSHSDLSHDQIAQKLNVSKSTIANSIVKARAFISDYLKKNLDVVPFLIMAKTFFL